ncbi:MAG: cupin domain-containing protein [Bacteroidota bacterium]
MEYSIKGNLLKNLPDDASEELLNIVYQHKNIRIEQIISSGQTSPEMGWYDQSENEWVLLLQGNAQIEFEDSGVVTLGTGDYLLIGARRKHKVVFTSKKPDCVWLAIFFGD